MNNKLFYKSGYIWIQNVPEFMGLYFVLSPRENLTVFTGLNEPWKWGQIREWDHELENVWWWIIIGTYTCIALTNDVIILTYRRLIYCQPKNVRGFINFVTKSAFFSLQNVKNHLFSWFQKYLSQKINFWK